MSDFNTAIPIVLQHEGGFVNNPADPGGKTNFGITQRFVDGLVQQGKLEEFDVTYMTVDQATSIYQTYWWNAYGYGNIADQSVATKVFDESVNIGPARMHKFVQQACCNLGVAVTVDGQLGPHTYAAVNSIDPTEMRAQLVSELVTFYNNLAQQNPKLQMFLKGWLARANS